MNERPGPAVPADLPAIIDLLEEAGLPTEDLDSASLAAFAVVRATGDESLLAAGALEIYGLDGLLRSIVVAPGCRGTGIGGRLTRHLIAQAHESALSSIWLLTTTASDYFPDFGFRKRARAEAPPAIAGTPEFARLCPDSAACLALELSDEQA